MKSLSTFLRCLSVFVVFLLLLPHHDVSAQKLFYRSEFLGGVTAGGYAPSCYDGSGTGTITLYFPPSARILSASLFAGNHQSSSPLTVTLNGKSFVYDNTNAVTSGFYSTYGEPASVHVVDVISAIDPTRQLQVLTVSGQQSTPIDKYTDFYLLVCYDAPNTNLTRVSVFLNTLDFQEKMDYNDLPISFHSRKVGDLALGLYTGYLCDTVTDREDIYCNSSLLGKIQGPETNSGDCGGPFANFYYEKGKLHGLGDDYEDMSMSGQDALSNIGSLVVKDDAVLDLRFEHNPSTSLSDNSIWGVIVVDGDTNCISPKISLTPSDLTGTSGDTVEFEIRINDSVLGKRSLDLDISVNSDLLEYVSYLGSNSVIYTEGHLHIEGDPFITSPNGVIATLRFAVFLSKDSTTKLMLSNLRLEPADSLTTSCPASLHNAISTFSYQYDCGQRSISKYMQDLLPLRINSIYPNPASEYLTLDLFSRSAKDISITIFNAFGERLASERTALRAGDQKTNINIKSLPAGIYMIELHYGSYLLTTKVLKFE